MENYKCIKCDGIFQHQLITGICPTCRNSKELLSTYAIDVGKSTYARCPHCANLHKLRFDNFSEDLIWQSDCKNGLYKITGIPTIYHLPYDGLKHTNVKAIDYGTHLLVHCPFCPSHHLHKLDTTITLADCQYGVYTITNKIHLSTNVITQRRLELI